MTTHGTAGAGQSQMEPPLEWDSQALREVKAILFNGAGKAGALIDAALCRCGDWIDWGRYRTHPVTSSVKHEDLSSIIRLMLPETDCGLRAGGYIELGVLGEQRLIEANGGYYDTCHEPKMVIGTSLPWHELNPQSLGQLILMMFDRITREYMDGGRSEAVINEGRTLTGDCLKSEVQ